MRAQFAGLLLALGCVSAMAQQAPAPPADPVFLAAKSTFEGIDIEARRAVQRDLVWAAGFTGGATGEFGPLTFAAIRRFETIQKSSVNGILDTAERAALAKAADSARAKTGFRIEADKATGMRIGVPTALFTRRSANSSGSERWQTADEKATLDLFTYKPEETLETLFVKGTDPKVAGRKIIYKLIRPEFIVIAGETAGGKFYRRVEKSPTGVLRAFSVGYDKATAATMDPLVIAMASTFEAFPGTPAAPAAPRTAATIEPATTAAAKAAPVKPHRITGIVVADRRIVTSEVAVRACKTIALDGPARMMGSVARIDAASGLALIATATPGVAPVAAAMGAPEALATLLQRDEDGKLLAAPAEIASGHALAPVQLGGAGAGIFDVQGRLSAIVISEPVVKYAVAGTMPVLRHRLASAADIAKFAEIAPVAGEAGAAVSAGDIAARSGSGVVSLFCGT